MNSKKKTVLGVIYIAATVGIILFIGFRNHNLHTACHVLSKLKKAWVLAAFCSMIVFILLEGYILHYFFEKQNIKISFLHTLKIAAIGLYYSCITPSSTGGQPVQVYYFKKYGVPAGASTSALAIKLICYQLSAVFGSIFSFFAFHGYIRRNLWSSMPFIITGLIVNLLPVIILLLLAFNKALLQKIAGGIVLFLHKIRLIKDKEKTLQKSRDFAEEYCRQLSYIKQNPRIFAEMMVLTAIQIISLMAVVFFVYSAFGLKKYSIFLLLALQFILYTSVSFAPLPGASGAQETGFYFYFNAIFPGKELYFALLLWRFFTYYLTLLFGGALVAFDGIADFLKRKRNPAG